MEGERSGYKGVESRPGVCTKCACRVKAMTKNWRLGELGDRLASGQDCRVRRGVRGLSTDLDRRVLVKKREANMNNILKCRTGIV